MPHGGKPLSPVLFELYIDGLEKHLLDMTDTDAPTLMGVVVPLLLYTDDLIVMSESTVGLQKQLDALASLYEECQVTVKLSRTKVVVFEHRHGGNKQRSAMVCRSIPRSTFTAPFFTVLTLHLL